MGRIATDISGHRFGTLVAKTIVGRSTGGAVLWRCDCDCGGSHTATYQSLKKGDVTRCAACRSAGRKVILGGEPLFNIHIKGQGGGVMGAMIVAFDPAGNLKAFGGWSSVMVKSSNPWSYRPIDIIVKDMIARGMLHSRAPGERFDAWEKRNRIKACFEPFVPTNVLVGLWDRAKALDLLANYPPEYITMWERNRMAALRSA